MIKTIFLLLLIITYELKAITVSGVIFDKLTNPIEEVTISYLSDGVEIITPVQSDSAGYWEFTFNQSDINENIIPNSIILGSNYPNPFNPGTLIPLTTHHPGLFIIHDILGREIQSIFIKQSGYYTLTWGGALRSGNPASAGIYFYSFITNIHHLTGKMILLDGGGFMGLSISSSYRLEHQNLNRHETERNNYSITYSSENITDITIDLGENGFTENIVLTQEVNRGPYWINELPNQYLQEGDTLSLNLNEYVYDDGQSIYQVTNTAYFEIIQDSLLWCIVLDSLMMTDIIVGDDEDSELGIESTIQIEISNTHIFFIADGDPEGIYVLNPYTMTYVDSLITQDTISYRHMTPNETGDTWYAIRNIHHPGQNILDTHIDWIDVESKEVFQTIEGSNNSIYLEKSTNGNKIITYDWNPSYTFSIYDSETGEFLGGRDTTLHVNLVRASKTEDIVYVWGAIRNTDILGDNRIGAWDIATEDWLWLVTYDDYSEMENYDTYYDMAVSHDGEHLFFRGSHGLGSSKFYDVNTQTGEVISEHYIYGFNELVPTKDNRYVYLTFNNMPWANWLEGLGGITRYDIRDNIIENVIESLHDLDYECDDTGFFGTMVMSVLPDNHTGIIFTGSYCPSDSTWDSHDYIVKVDLENIEFIEGIHMPTTTMPGYQTQYVYGPFFLGKYPY
jgi:hypothetical protein